MKTTDAAYLVVHDYPGGAESLAPRIGKRASSLCHEVRPGDSTAKLGLEDAFRISEVTADHRILFAFAEALGYRVVRVDEAPQAANLLEAAARFSRETGEALAAMSAAIEGGTTANEILRFEAEVGQIAPAALVLADAFRAARDADLAARGGR